MRPEEYREATLAEQTGWWVHHQQNSVELEPPPASLEGGFAISLEVARSALLAKSGEEGQSLACNIFQTETLPTMTALQQDSGPSRFGPNCTSYGAAASVVGTCTCPVGDRIESSPVAPRFGNPVNRINCVT